MYYIYDLLLFIYFDISIMQLNIQTTSLKIKSTSVCLYISEQHQSVYIWSLVFYYCIVNISFSTQMS